MPRKHGDDGTFIETVALDDVLEVFDAVEGPVVLSADVANELGCTRETARQKLEQLHDRGDLSRRKVSRRVIYWRREASMKAATDAAASTPAEQSTDETPAGVDSSDGNDAELSADSLRGDGSNTLADLSEDDDETGHSKL